MFERNCDTTETRVLEPIDIMSVSIFKTRKIIHSSNLIIKLARRKNQQQTHTRPTISIMNISTLTRNTSNKSMASDTSSKQSSFRTMKTNIRERFGNYKSSVRKGFQSMVDDMGALHRSYNHPEHYTTGPLFAAQYNSNNPTTRTYSNTDQFYYLTSS